MAATTGEENRQMHSYDRRALKQYVSQGLFGSACMLFGAIAGELHVINTSSAAILGIGCLAASVLLERVR